MTIFELILLFSVPVIAGAAVALIISHYAKPKRPPRGVVHCACGREHVGKL